MHALDDLTPIKAFGIGAVLLAVSPAELVVYLSAEHGISNQTAGARLLLTILLIAAIDLCILIPIGIYVAIPNRATRILTRGREWLIAHQRRLMAWMLTIFGVLLIVTATVHLA
jgi:threonine/homoserine/homoserine lactone efflux protein